MSHGACIACNPFLLRIRQRYQKAKNYVYIGQNCDPWAMNRVNEDIYDTQNSENRILAIPKINSEAKKISQVNPSNSDIFIIMVFERRENGSQIRLVGRRDEREREHELVSNILQVPIYG